MAASKSLLLFLAFATAAAIVSAHNITDMLKDYPEYSDFSNYLQQTRLADEINSRQTITVLVVSNGALSPVVAKHPLSVIKNLLSLHIVLDYYDPAKLHKISNGTTLSTTLYQTTGHAPGNLGFVNITDLQGGKVAFGSAAPGSKLESSYTKSVVSIPYNISVIEISAPIVASGILTAPAPSASDVNITAALEKAGCKTFASLIVSNGVIKTYESAVEKGLTIFAPNDEAFKADGVPDLSKLTNAEVVSLLLYHALPGYTPIGALKTTKDPIDTLATGSAGKFDITTTTAGDAVTLHTGIGPSRIADTVLDATPLAIFSVDSLLLPSELFGKSPSPAPAPEPVSSPSPTPSLAPSPSPSAKAPSPFAASPPAPPSETPEGSPANAPTAEAQTSTPGSSAVHVKGSVIVVVAAIATTMISSLFLY
ncbi:fasciclin-like arabinogalactan protein 10 [Benincasa hispida]|uniref:fasciclin-like arabinogalactan protein 10 n=1 Tax=Benincasa hispida TaxID=102211 RepID=UPI0019017EDA|nr:fasciclin-like arabinogalactan protein 10 [Benincasa hispida]